MKKYFYIKLKDPGFNIKTSPILNNYIKNFIPINIDENKCKTPEKIENELKTYDKLNYIIIFYQHKSSSIFKNNLIKYLNNKKNVFFEFYLFTFDFWHLSSINNFKAKNHRVITFAKNVDQLDIFLKKKGHKKWEKNLIFKNFWCCYNQSILNLNLNPTNKLLISGARNKINYPERFILHNMSNKNENLISLGKNSNDITSTDYLYNKRLNSYFACFSSSVYFWNKNTHIILLKTFEILGSGSLLVMPMKEKKYILNIGLKHMHNCYLIDFSKNLDNQINYIFSNIDLFNRIRKNGRLHAIKHLNENKMINEIKHIIES